jgi:hypothetical protein
MVCFIVKYLWSLAVVAAEVVIRVLVEGRGGFVIQINTQCAVRSPW